MILRRGDGVLRYQGRFSLPKVDDLKNQFIEGAHGSCYSIHPGSTKKYDYLRELFLEEGLTKEQ